MQNINTIRIRSAFLAVLVADLDLDCDVDMSDWSLLQLSFTGPLP